MAFKDIELSPLEWTMRSVLQRYDHEKYWRYRAVVIDPKRGTKLGDMLRLYYIKRADAFNNASMGTHRNLGARFAQPPQLPHGLNGIIVSHNVVVGKNCRIYHQVTIGEGQNGAPVIGDDVVIGAGAKIVGNVRVGSHVRIAPGCVIMRDIPDNSLVLPGENSIVIREMREHVE